MNIFFKLKFVHKSFQANFSNMPNDVLINKINNCGIITLNRIKALNSLNKSMVNQIYPILSKWVVQEDITHVIIEGVGEKAFCAGGDIKKLIEDGKSNLNNAATFFKEEYRLNYLIGSMKKPFIALIDGITMGGGVGLSVHGKYRVATERTVFAMPETAIGFYPDVGGSFFLARLPRNLGVYLGLVGARLAGEDVVHAGVATHYVGSGRVQELRDELIHASSRGDIDGALEKYKNPINPRNFCLAKQLDWIDAHFGLSSVEGILGALGEAARSSGDVDERHWAQRQIDVLQKMSPISLKVTLRQLQEGRRMTFREVFTMEYRLSKRMLENHDFYEGVRALLVDKDNSPKWQPPSLSEVSSAMVDEYFKPVSDDLVL